MILFFLLISYLPAIDDAAADGAPPSHTFEFSSNFAFKEITKKNEMLRIFSYNKFN